MFNREDIARNLYETYCAAVGGKAFNGDPLPTWDEFAIHPDKQVQVNGWLLAADRAIQMLA